MRLRRLHAILNHNGKGITTVIKRSGTACWLLCCAVVYARCEICPQSADRTCFDHINWQWQWYSRGLDSTWQTGDLPSGHRSFPRYQSIPLRKESANRLGHVGAVCLGSQCNGVDLRVPSRIFSGGEISSKLWCGGGANTHFPWSQSRSSKDGSRHGKQSLEDGIYRGMRCEPIRSSFAMEKSTIANLWELPRFLGIVFKIELSIGRTCCPYEPKSQASGTKSHHFFACLMRLFKPPATGLSNPPITNVRSCSADYVFLRSRKGPIHFFRLIDSLEIFVPRIMTTCPRAFSLLITRTIRIKPWSLSVAVINPSVLEHNWFIGGSSWPITLHLLPTIVVIIFFQPFSWAVWHAPLNPYTDKSVSRWGMPNIQRKW